MPVFGKTGNATHQETRRPTSGLPQGRIITHAGVKTCPTQTNVQVESGRVPGDVFDFSRVTGNSKQRRSGIDPVERGPY